MDLLSSEAYIGLAKRNDSRPNTLLQTGLNLERFIINFGQGDVNDQS